MKETLDELLSDIKRLLALKRWNYSYEMNDWFFPSDLIPHSTSVKYRCKKLFIAGLLERQGSSSDRWGYRYRIPPSSALEG